MRVSTSCGAAAGGSAPFFSKKESRTCFYAPHDEWHDNGMNFAFQRILVSYICSYILVFLLTYLLVS